MSLRYAFSALFVAFVTFVVSDKVSVFHIADEFVNASAIVGKQFIGWTRCAIIFGVSLAGFAALVTLDTVSRVLVMASLHVTLLFLDAFLSPSKHSFWTTLAILFEFPIATDTGFVTGATGLVLGAYEASIVDTSFLCYAFPIASQEVAFLTG